jgi:mannose-6-phosphate isomerase-like protein (cupin superfamily)
MLLFMNTRRQAEFPCKLSGHIQMHVRDKVFDLPAGHLLARDRVLPHDVRALEGSAFLLTIAWPEAGKRHLNEYSAANPAFHEG